MKKLILLYVVLVIHIPCYGQKRNHFTIDIKKPASGHKHLRLDGAYLFCEEIKYSRSVLLYFYPDGTYYQDGPVPNTRVSDPYNCNEIVKKIREHLVIDPFSFGLYSVSGDTLITQLTQQRVGAGLPITLYERKWLIKMDSLISIPRVTTYSVFPFRKEQEVYYFPDARYFYYRVPSKPNTSRAWFKDKRWYIEAISKRKK
jgi:hypothetical protein